MLWIIIVRCADLIGPGLMSHVGYGAVNGTILLGFCIAKAVRGKRCYSIAVQHEGQRNERLATAAVQCPFRRYTSLRLRLYKENGNFRQGGDSTGLAVDLKSISATVSSALAGAWRHGIASTYMAALSGSDSTGMLQWTFPATFQWLPTWRSANLRPSSY